MNTLVNAVIIGRQIAADLHIERFITWKVRGSFLGTDAGIRTQF